MKTSQAAGTLKIIGFSSSNPRFARLAHMKIGDENIISVQNSLSNYSLISPEMLAVLVKDFRLSLSTPLFNPEVD